MGIYERSQLSGPHYTSNLHLDTRISKSQNVGIFLSDISGAFDRVSRELLLEKLQRTGLDVQLLRFIGAYLSPRTAKVVIKGQASDAFALQDMIFQGTVLGPSFWNIFFRDVREAAQSTGGCEAKFADYLKKMLQIANNSFVSSDYSDCIFKIQVII